MPSFFTIKKGVIRMERCADNGIKIDGHEVDPCLYEDVLVLKNVTVRLSRCVRCGHEEWSWERQEDTIDVTEPLNRAEG